MLPKLDHLESTGLSVYVQSAMAAEADRKLNSPQPGERNKSFWLLDEATLISLESCSCEIIMYSVPTKQKSHNSFSK